jgi:hypothetical protein
MKTYIYWKHVQLYVIRCNYIVIKVFTEVFHTKYPQRNVHVVFHLSINEKTLLMSIAINLQLMYYQIIIL